MATFGNVMSNMLSIFVATAGIVKNNMRSNYVIVYSSIDKPICSVLQTEARTNFLFRLCLLNRFDFPCTTCLFCFSASLCCYWHP